MDQIELQESILADRVRFGDLSWARLANRPNPSDRTITRGALRTLTNSIDTSDDSQWHELVELELAESRGQLTDFGVRMRGLLASGSRFARILSRTGSTTREALAVFDEHFALTAFGPAPAHEGESESESDGEVLELAVCHPETLALRLLTWLGTSPAWSVGSVEPLAPGELGALIAGSGDAIRPSESGQLGAMAAHRWHKHSLQFGASDPVDFVEVDEWGYFVVAGAKDALQLHPFPSDLFAAAVIEGVRAQLY